MYRMKSPSRCRPPLPESLKRTHARRVLQSNASIRTPSASLTKTQPSTRSRRIEELRIRPELQSMSCEFRALVKFVEDFGNSSLSTPFTATAGTTYSSLFERGRMYDEYSARRNERLKRKKGEAEADEEMGVHESRISAVEFGKRRNAKGTESVRKSVPANLFAGRREGLRSSVRMSNEKKQPFPAIEADNKKRMGARTTARGG